jgi:hypothetical protein
MKPKTYDDCVKMSGGICVPAKEIAALYEIEVPLTEEQILAKQQLAKIKTQEGRWELLSASEDDVSRVVKDEAGLAFLANSKSQEERWKLYQWVDSGSPLEDEILLSILHNAKDQDERHEVYSEVAFEDCKVRREAVRLLCEHHS